MSVKIQKAEDWKNSLYQNELEHFFLLERMAVDEGEKVIDKMLSGMHGAISFSPSKGIHCDILRPDGHWVRGTGSTIMSAVEAALELHGGET